MKPYSSDMKSAVLRILEKHDRLEVFCHSKEFHYRIERESYLPLVVERQGNRVTVTHYSESNGDNIADPDMEFLIGADSEWYPVALQLWNGSYYRARRNDEGREFINPKQVCEQLSFARMWARNLRHQGW